MTPERYQRAVEIFQAALDLPATERARWLEHECAGDIELKDEVQRMLGADSHPATALNRPAAELAPALLRPEPVRSLLGQQLGGYKVLSSLGSGGMGEVYLAEDVRLGRKAALKLLPSGYATDPDRLQRFEQEARALSALNHPNIVTIYGVDQAGSLHFLATEYIEGISLRQWMTAKHDLAGVLDLASQIASALAAAHAAGIVHRDIKPENILIRKDGIVKVLDFGIAKLAGPKESAGKEPPGGMQTRPGMILGTPSYMSPEQAQGQLIDARSDVFSFGVVLYEMVTGQRPFAGATDLDILHAVVHNAMPPLQENRPPGLRATLEKALEKNPADRYQAISEILIDLRRLARRTSETRAVAGARTDREFRWVWSVGLLALALLAATIWITLRNQQQRPTTTQLEYTQLTHFVDSVTSPALSPDGRMLAFIRGESSFLGPGQVYVKILPDGEPVQLTNDNLRKMSPKFSPDGSRIAYTVRETSWNTWIVPVLGGQPPRRFLENASGLTWIAGANRHPLLLFSEMTGRAAQMPIVASTESRTEHRTIYLPPESGMAHRSALSPDGKQVLLVEMNYGGWLPCRLSPFAGVSPGATVGPAPSQCTAAEWSPDGQWMYFSADTGNGFHIWRQRFPDGKPEQVTYGVTQEEGIAFAPDGRSFVTSIGSVQNTVWYHDASGDRQITSEGYAFMPSIGTDGKNLYYLVRAGQAGHFVSGTLWVTNLESGSRQKLLADFPMQHYDISSDGQRVVFISEDRQGRTPAWVAALNGRSAPRQLAEIDARRVFFGTGGDVFIVGEEKGKSFVFRINENARESREVLPAPGLFDLAGVSPNGQWLVAPGATDELLQAVLLYPARGGSPKLMCRSCTESVSRERGIASRPLTWTGDSKFVYLRFRTATYAIPLRPGQVLPEIPERGFQSVEEVASLRGAKLIADFPISPGPDLAAYTFTKVSTQRNIYRVPVP